MIGILFGESLNFIKGVLVVMEEEVDCEVVDSDLVRVGMELLERIEERK